MGNQQKIKIDTKWQHTYLSLIRMGFSSHISLNASAKHPNNMKNAKNYAIDLFRLQIAQQTKPIIKKNLTKKTLKNTIVHKNELCGACAYTDWFLETYQELQKRFSDKIAYHGTKRYPNSIIDAIKFVSSNEYIPNPLCPTVPIKVCDNNGIMVTFYFIKIKRKTIKIHPEVNYFDQQPSITSILAVFCNNNPYPIDDFLFRVAVPKYVKLCIDSANGKRLLSTDYIKMIESKAIEYKINNLLQHIDKKNIVLVYGYIRRNVFIPDCVINYFVIYTFPLVFIKQRFQLTNLKASDKKKTMMKFQVKYNANGIGHRFQKQVDLEDHCCSLWSDIESNKNDKVNNKSTNISLGHDWCDGFL